MPVKDHTIECVLPTEILDPYYLIKIILILRAVSEMSLFIHSFTFYIFSQPQEILNAKLQK